MLSEEGRSFPDLGKSFLRITALLPLLMAHYVRNCNIKCNLCFGNVCAHKQLPKTRHKFKEFTG